MRFFFALIFLLFSLDSFGQNIQLRGIDIYKRADSIALNFPKGRYKTYQEIVEPLTANLKTEEEKFRVIFRWIADNVSYSYSNESGDPDKTLMGRKAVCVGYSSLLKEMCNDAGLDCEVITGWSKVGQGDIGQKMKKTTHAWNAIKLNGKWHLTDITWATSKYDKQKKKFYKYFDTAYFLPTPEFFIKQHFPKDKKWQMLQTPVKKSWFIKSYVWYEAADKYGVKIVSPTRGWINQNDNKEFTIILTMNKPVSGHSFAFVMDDDYKDVQFFESQDISSKELGQYSVTLKYHFPKNLKGNHDIDVFYNGEEISGFRIKFH